MQKRFTVIFLLLLLSATGFCQELTDKRLASSIDKLLFGRFSPQEPGIALLVARKGKMVYQGAHGLANLELNIPLAPGMVFRVGSVTKQFTALAILQLVEQNRLHLNDSLRQHISIYPPKPYTITIAHLLNHSSGIPDYMAKDHPDPYIERRDFTPADLINHIKDDSLLAVPGTQFIYSNSNYVLLGLIIEKVTGQSYHQYVKEHILTPLGLAHSCYARENTIVPARVPGYSKSRNGFENTYLQSITLGYACGDLLSTVGDLYQWNRGVFEYRLLKKETMDKALIPFRNANGSSSRYGYGWMIDSIYGRTCYRHDGSVSGFGADIRYFPGEDVFIAALTNGRSHETDLRTAEVIAAVSELALGKAVRKEIKMDPAQLQSYAGTYALNPEHKIFVTVEKGQLHIEGSNPADKMSKIAVSPFADNWFFVKGIDFTIEFFRENGTITKLMTTYGGKTQYEWVREK